MAAPMHFDFQSSREEFEDLLEKVLEDDSFEVMQARFKELPGSDADKKSAMDQALKDALHMLVMQLEHRLSALLQLQYIFILDLTSGFKEFGKDSRKTVNDSPCEAYKQMITLATTAVTLELCSPSTPFVLLSDTFDGITLDKCADMFTYVEDRVSTWKSDTFHTAGKNYLLRMCNDLLRRLSKSQNTLFCGRIQLFLARLFPLSEKSGLNLMSQFNLENLTYFNTESSSHFFSKRKSVDSDHEEPMEMEEGEADERSSSVPIDYNLYKKFWSLQDFFRKPSQCYDKLPWKTFTNYTSEVLGCFESYKLDDLKGRKKKLEQLKAAKAHSYFAKYLTSEKLLDLQLSDSNFRRYVLVQFLVLFHYLQAHIRFKNPNMVLSDDAQSWVKSTSEHVYKLMRETPPDGDQFAKAIEHIMNREENWNSWKNDSCPSYVREAGDAPTTPTPRGKKRSLGEDLKHGGKLIKMGSSELTRLWNLNRDNMEACSAQKRAFVPSLESFFAEAIEQADPDEMVEDEYKLINNSTWSWKALRLLSRQSPHFFTQAQQTGKKLGEYLESIMKKLVTDRSQENGSTTAPPPPSAPENEEKVKTDVGEEEEIREDQEAEKSQEASQPEDVELNCVTKEEIQQVAEEMQGDWKKLAHELNYPDDEIEYWESESSDVTQQAIHMLTLWKESEGDQAQVGALRESLTQIGLLHVANKVFGEVMS